VNRRSAELLRLKEGEAGFSLLSLFGEVCWRVAVEATYFGSLPTKGRVVI